MQLNQLKDNPPGAILVKRKMNFIKIYIFRFYILYINTKVVSHCTQQ